MPPCHGGDRRFESGRARHYVNKYRSTRAVFCLLAYKLGIQTSASTPLRLQLPPSQCGFLDILVIFLTERLRYISYSTTVLNLRGLQPGLKHLDKQVEEFTQGEP